MHTDCSGKMKLQLCRGGITHPNTEAYSASPGMRKMVSLSTCGTTRKSQTNLCCCSYLRIFKCSRSVIWDSWSASHLAIGWTHLSLDKLQLQPLMPTLSAPCVTVNKVCRAAVSGTKLLPWAFLLEANRVCHQFLGSLISPLIVRFAPVAR